jgi:hypothetical protein
MWWGALLFGGLGVLAFFALRRQTLAEAGPATPAGA